MSVDAEGRSRIPILRIASNRLANGGGRNLAIAELKLLDELSRFAEAE